MNNFIFIFGMGMILFGRLISVLDKRFNDQSNIEKDTEPINIEKDEEPDVHMEIFKTVGFGVILIMLGMFAVVMLKFMSDYSLCY